MSYKDPLSEYDLEKFVAWILKTFPPDEPKLPFSDEHEKARLADQKRDADRESTIIGELDQPSFYD